MGIRPASLYAAFGDKQSLFKEVVAAYGHSPAGALVGAALREETTAYAAFARILREAAEIYPATPTPMPWPDTSPPSSKECHNAPETEPARPNSSRSPSWP
jgi:AcrR family transcriptional regulator